MHIFPEQGVVILVEERASEDKSNQIWIHPVLWEYPKVCVNLQTDVR